MSASRVALVAGGVVLDVIIADLSAGNYPIPSGVSAYALNDGSPVGRGWLYDDGEWTSPTAGDGEGGGETPALTLEDLIAQMQQVVNTQQDQLALQQAQLDGLIDFIMMGM